MSEDNNITQTDLEIEVLSTVVNSALNGLLVASYINNIDMTITFVGYRQCTLQLATYLKLSSIFKMNSPIDCHVVDRIDDKFRFNVIYNLQSFNNNIRVQLVTKTNDLLPLVSLQGIYPAFN